MLQIITIVLPVFGLILLGWTFAKTGYLSETAGKGLSEFAFEVAMPALLFKAVLGIGTWPSSPINLILAYFSAAAIVWILATIFTSVVLRRPAADGSALAMGSVFSNSVMLGIPLALSAFGPEAAAPAALLVSIDSPVFWIAATMHLSASQLGDKVSPWKALGNIIADLARNPIIMSLVLGTLGRFAGLELPPLVDRAVSLVADAAVPTALFALGMSLATYRMAGQGPTLAMLCILKLLAFPVLTFVMCVYVFEVQPLWTAIATLFAAMPVGANAYLFAARYEKAIGSVSTSIAVSTAIAVFTVTGLLYWLKASFDPTSG